MSGVREIQWCQIHKKTKAMIISPTNNIEKSLEFNNSNNLVLHNHSIVFSEVKQLLGIQVDNNLNWIIQVEKY